MKTSTIMPEITPKAREGIDRFGEILAEYTRMRGVTGDVLKIGSRDLLTGILADAFHWASMSGIDALGAFCEAYRIAVEEAVTE